MPDTETYRLKNDYERLVAPGLVLERGESVELEPAEAEKHPELQRVGGADEEE